MLTDEKFSPPSRKAALRFCPLMRQHPGGLLPVEYDLQRLAESHIVSVFDFESFFSSLFFAIKEKGVGWRAETRRP